MTCRWRHRWNFPVQALLDGRFAATNLRPVLARLGPDCVKTPMNLALGDFTRRVDG